MAKKNASSKKSNHEVKKLDVLCQNCTKYNGSNCVSYGGNAIHIIRLSTKGTCMAFISRSIAAD